MQQAAIATCTCLRVFIGQASKEGLRSPWHAAIHVFFCLRLAHRSDEAQGEAIAEPTWKSWYAIKRAACLQEASLAHVTSPFA